MTLSGSDVRPMKTQIRLAASAKRKSIPKAERNKLSEVIQHSLANTKEFNDARTIMLYKATEVEVSTDKLIDLSIRSKTVLLPVIIGDSLIPVKYHGVLKEGSFGLLEPEGEAFTGKIDLIIVPIVAFDSENNRIGRGLGYYDRFLKKYKCSKIGIAFELQRVASIPVEPHDEKFDFMITEKGVLNE
jgi:5-formyltetrahydrofolate cyclo-ligase